MPPNKDKTGYISPYRARLKAHAKAHDEFHAEALKNQTPGLLRSFQELTPENTRGRMAKVRLDEIHRKAERNKNPTRVRPDDRR